MFGSLDDAGGGLKADVLPVGLNYFLHELALPLTVVIIVFSRAGVK